MLASQRRKLNQFQSKLAFMRDNAADFPAASPGGKAADALADSIQLILSLAGQQSSNVQSQHIGIKADNLDKLLKLMQKMNRAANSMADEVDGIEDLFRMPRRRSEQMMLAAARTFYSDSLNYNAAFLDYDLPATFRADLMTLIDRIEAAAGDADAAGAQKGGATSALLDSFRDAGKQSNKLDGIVENKYDDNPQKLAQWRIAAHLEAAPQTAKAEEKKVN